MAKFDISVKEVEYIKFNVKEESIDDIKFNVPVSSKLVLDFEGEDSKTEIINALRRVALDDLPTYAFPSQTIDIQLNNTIFDNDYMRLRLSQLPVINTTLDLDVLDNKYWKDVMYNDKNREKHPLEELILININAVNNSPSNKNITTNDIEYTYGDRKIQNKYNSECPILLIQLRPGESFKSTMKAVLGVGELHDIWSAASNCYYDDNCHDALTGEEKPNKNNRITFTIESQGQFTEHEILKKSCRNIVYRTSQLKKDILEKIKEEKLNEENKDNEFIKLVFNGENATLCAVINEFLQNHKDVIFSGLSHPDKLIRSMTIKVAFEDRIKDISKPISDVLDDIIRVYTQLEKDFDELSKKDKHEKAEKLEKKEKKMKTKK
jgi:DNA-directed RNA polymerase subunit L